MVEIGRSKANKSKFSNPAIFYWRIAQAAVWLVGLFIFISLVFWPDLGINLFWNVLIPVAPLLFVVAVGVWRNICPLATTTLLPRHFGLSKKRKLTFSQIGKLNLIGVVFLYLIVPVRHMLFDASGLATALLIAFLVVVGLVTGFFFDWKSAWCSGLCPVHSVEKLYGSNVLASPANAHCTACVNCVTPCPDSTPNYHPVVTQKTMYHKLTGILITGGLPGFVWGWFHVADRIALPGLISLLPDFFLPITGLLVSAFLYFGIRQVVNPKAEKVLNRIFAAAGVSIYYWYRLPALIGFGLFENDGQLINLADKIPSWTVTLMTIGTTVFFFYWLVVRDQNKKSWAKRPNFA